MTGAALTYLAYRAFGFVSAFGFGSGFGVVLRSSCSGSLTTGGTGTALSDFLFLGNLSNRGPFSFGLSGLPLVLVLCAGVYLEAEFYLLALLLILLVISGWQFVGFW